MREVEHPRNGKSQVSSCDGSYHGIAYRLSPYDAVGATVVGVVVGYELTVAVALAGGACRHSDAEGERLLQDEHQHGGQDT